MAHDDSPPPSEGTAPRSEDCPSPSPWASFARGALSGLRLAELAEHLESCSSCLSELEAVEDDDLVLRLRDLDAATPGEAPESPALGSAAPRPAPIVPPELRERIEALRPSSGDPGSQGDELRDTADPHSRYIAQLLDEVTRGPVPFDRFTLLQELGCGSFGHVFLAEDPQRAAPVALKVPRSGAQSSFVQRMRFQREADSVASEQHPGLVATLEKHEWRGIPYLVCEYIDGETLADRVTLPNGSFEASLRNTVAWMREVGEALEVLHRRGAVHRDIKPSNILIDRAGRAHLSDFGLVKLDAPGTTLTFEGELLGTPAYMSPELARGEGAHVDPRSDVFSLGVVLYELLTGERPFRGTRRMVLAQVDDADPRPPRRLDDRVPKALERVCLKAMSRTRARRYPSAGAFAADLARYERGERVEARGPGPLERLVRWARTQPLATSLLLAIPTASLAGILHLGRLSGELVRDSARDSAAQYAALLELVNDLYSTEVVAKLGHHGIEATADYASVEGGVPLPATLLTLLLARVGEGPSGMEGSHFSEYPFPQRQSIPTLDGFQQNALSELQRSPDEAFVCFERDEQGRSVVRHATARVMAPACVTCHNTHPDSPKRDWEVGDVRGVLEIVRPLEADEERIRAALRGTTGLVLILAVGFAALTLRLARRRQALGTPSGGRAAVPQGSPSDLGSASESGTPTP